MEKKAPPAKRVRKDLHRALNGSKTAESGAPLLSPKQIMELEKDPEKFEAFARMLSAVNLDNLFRQMQNPTTPVAARIEFQKVLNKMGGIDPGDKAGAAGGQQVVINITRARDREDEAITIDATGGEVA